MKLTLVEGANTKTLETEIQTEMTKHLQHFDRELAKLRTGRAHPSMVEDIKISCYGTVMPLKEVGAISAPEPQMILVQPWDKTIIADIEKSISASDLGVTPLNDGTVIRLVLPKMSSSRRDELVKVLGKKLEECRISLRGVRKDAHTIIRDAEKDKKISEDYSKRLQDVLQKVTDKQTESAEALAAKKEAEIKSV